MESVASCTSFISSRTQPLFRRFFTWLGSYIYLYHGWFMAFGVLLTMLCTAGGATYFVFNCNESSCIENRLFYLWIPRDSTVWTQYREIIDIFGSYPSQMSLLLKTADVEESIITPANMDISYNIFQSIDHITLDYQNNEYHFQDICLRSSPTALFCDAAFANFFGYFFDENKFLWNNESVIEDSINIRNAQIAFFLGGLQFDDNVVVGAQSMRLVYELEGSTNKTTQDIVYKYMGKFQNYWAKHAQDYADDIQVSYLTDRSFDDEVSRVLTADIRMFGLALITMAVYLMFTLGSISCIGARPWLAFSAVWVVLCALAMGFSISLCIGTTFNIMVLLVPFILLGVGVDDMIILVDTYDKTAMPDDDILNAHCRLGNALASSGLSISLTAFCSSMAFFVGSAIDIPGVSSFCVYAAWSFLCNYLLQFLIFVPLMVMDDGRIRKKKNFCCPCLCSHDKKLHDKQINFFDPEKIVKNNGAISATKYKNDNTDKNLSSSICNKCNAGYFLSRILFPILSRRICRIVIILFFLITLGASIYLAQFIKTESGATKLIADDSFIVDYINYNREAFGDNVVDELQIILHNQDFSDHTVRRKIKQMMIDMELQEDAIGVTSNWLHEFEMWLEIKDKNISDLESFEFYSQLQTFANSSSVWNSEIKYDDMLEAKQIKWTRFILRISKADRTDKQYPQYLAWNAILNTYSLDGYAFVPEYCFAFLSNSILKLTMDNMLFAALAIFCILILFLDLRLSIFILMIVLMIDVNLFGWMYVMDISLDTLSYSQCAMAVALTVDYVVHITHAIIDANHKQYNEKLRIALSEMAASVIKGAFATFLGALALIFSESQALRIFFQMLTGIIIIAVGHGCILAPVLLAECTFIYAGIASNANGKNLNDATKKESHKAASDIVNNLRFAHTVTVSNGSDLHGVDEYNGEISTNPKQKITDIGIGSDKINPKKRKSIQDEKRASIQMANFHSSSVRYVDDDSLVDQFED